MTHALMLCSEVIQNKRSFHCSAFWSTPPIREIPKGFLVGRTRSETFAIAGSKNDRTLPLILVYGQEHNGVLEQGVMLVEHTILRKRILAYLQQYYGIVSTNCSTMAEYLLTGVFQECLREQGAFAFTRGMHTYTGQGVEVGDCICILYFDTVVGKRSMPEAYRSLYRKNALLGTSWENVVQPEMHISSEEIREEYCLGVYADFHFMVCIGKASDGDPLFIQQMGLQRNPASRSEGRPPVVVTKGKHAFSPYSLAHVLIKKGRF